MNCILQLTNNDYLETIKQHVIFCRWLWNLKLLSHQKNYLSLTVNGVSIIQFHCNKKEKQCANYETNYIRYSKNR